MVFGICIQDIKGHNRLFEGGASSTGKSETIYG